MGGQLAAAVAAGPRLEMVDGCTGEVSRHGAFGQDMHGSNTTNNELLMQTILDGSVEKQQQ